MIIEKLSIIKIYKFTCATKPFEITVPQHLEAKFQEWMSGSVKPDVFLQALFDDNTASGVINLFIKMATLCMSAGA